MARYKGAGILIEREHGFLVLTPIVGRGRYATREESFVVEPKDKAGTKEEIVERLTAIRDRIKNQGK